MQGLLLISLLIISTQALVNEGFLIPPPAAMNPYAPPEAQGWFPNFTQLVTKLHYPVQIHTITTEDGYILTWFRIQAKNQKGFKEGLPVVLCMHGVGDSGDTFVVNEEKLSLGLLLANEGYDVWVGNVRGTKYGLKHTNKKIKAKDFWNFSWQDMSKYDIPAGFEYIHKATGQNITYVGHSQGTVIMFAALAEEDPTVLKYLKNFVALSPVAFVSHVQSGILKYMANSTLGETFLRLGMYSFLQPGFFQSEMGHLFCKVLPNVCANQLGKIYGFNPEFDNYKQINIILEHEPGGTSVVNLLHWKQLVHSGRFCKFDYGSEKENMKHYGQKTPPDYNLSKIKMPVNMFFGKYDDIIGDEDSHLLIKALNGTSSPSFAQFYTADHMTWLWSKNTSFFYEDFITKVRGN